MNNFFRNLDWLFSVGWIIFFTALAVADVGQESSCGEIYPWYLPLLVLSLMAVPAKAAYDLGRDRGERGE